MIVMLYDHARGEALPWVIDQATYDRLMPKEPEPMPEKNDYACADCGTETDTMKGTCRKCGSVRLVLISVIEEVAGPNWRDKLEQNPNPLTPDHPEIKAAEEHHQRLRRWRESGKWA